MKGSLHEFFGGSGPLDVGKQPIKRRAARKSSSAIPASVGAPAMDGAASNSQPPPIDPGSPPSVVESVPSTPLPPASSGSPPAYQHSPPSVAETVPSTPLPPATDVGGATPKASMGSPGFAVGQPSKGGMEQNDEDDGFGSSLSGLFNEGPKMGPASAGEVSATSRGSLIPAPLSPGMTNKAEPELSDVVKSLAALGTKPNDQELRKDIGSLDSIFTEKAKLHAKTECTDPEEVELLKAVQDGFDLRGKWGQRFSRSAEGKSAEYKSLNRAAKDQLRKDWAATQLDEVTKKKVRSEVYQRVDASKGVYMPFFVLWQKEGGAMDPCALAAAVKHASRCLAMAGPWVSINPLTDRVEFLHLERSVSEVFTRCWSMFEEQTSAVAAGDDQTGNAETVVVGGAANGTSGTPLKQKASKAELKKKADGDEGGGAPNKKTKTSTPLEQAFADAIAVKKLMASSTTQAKSVLEAMEHDTEWQYAIGMAPPLKASVASLTQAMTTFARAFLSKDSNQMRKAVSDPTELIDGLQQFTCTFKPLVNTCDKETRRIVAMHQAKLNFEQKG
jgi:hypothetical protein